WLASVFGPPLVDVGSLAARRLRNVCALARFSTHDERSRASSLRLAATRLARCELPSLCAVSLRCQTLRMETLSPSLQFSCFGESWWQGNHVGLNRSLKGTRRYGPSFSRSLVA